MPTYNLPTETNINFSEGLDRLFVYVAQEVPLFIPAVLISLFFIVFITGILAQRRQEGRADTPMWFTISGWITATAAMIMLLVDDLIMLETVIISISVAMIGAIWLFISKDR